MANYFEMNRDELVAEQEKLKEQYKKFQDMQLKLNMARGKPGPHQMDLAMGLLQMTDYTPTPAPMPATTVIWRVCTKPAFCSRISSASSPKRSSWAATPVCS